jgi:AraC family transcriptional regulator, transcriptional activator of pobA
MPPARTRRSQPGIRQLGIYGDPSIQPDALDLHIEELQARASSLHYSIKPHAHRDMLQLFVSVSGRCVATIDGEVHRIAGPCAISIPGGMAHCFEFGPSAKGWILTIAHRRVIAAPLDRNDDNVAALLRQPHVARARRGSTYLRGMAMLLAMLHEEFHAARPGRRAALGHLASLVLLHHWREVEPSQARDPHADGDRRLFYEFRALVEQHFARQWSIADYARALRCSQPRLNRICRQLAGASANGVVLDRLCEEARRLLAFTTAPASAIGRQLGFQEPSYFARFFRKRAGMTPGEFRAGRSAPAREG